MSIWVGADAPVAAAATAGAPAAATAGASAVSAWATPVTPRSAVDSPIVPAARKPNTRRDGDVSCTSTPLILPERRGGARRSGRTHQTTPEPDRPVPPRLTGILVLGVTRSLLKEVAAGQDHGGSRREATKPASPLVGNRPPRQSGRIVPTTCSVSVAALRTA